MSKEQVNSMKQILLQKIEAKLNTLGPQCLKQEKVFNDLVEYCNAQN